MMQQALNAVIYARYSSHNQTEQSIEGQLRDCYAFAEREGLQVVGEYIDRAITGRTDERPDFQRMIADARKQEFQRVIVWKFDRFSRDRYDSAIYKHKLKQCGVRVLSAMENVGEGDVSIILEALLEASAEQYSLDLSKKVLRGQRESRLKGTFLGGLTPIGYKLENRKLVADERTAPIVRYIFEQYAKGTSKQDIINELATRGILNRHGKPLSHSTLQTILKNKKYIGVYTHGGQDVAGGCEALIDEKTFLKVQEQLSKRKHAPAASKAVIEYLLQGKLYCGYCGFNMFGDSGRGRNGSTYRYYACRRRKKERDCKKKNEKKDFIEWYVVEQTVEYVLTPERIEYIASELVAQYKKDCGIDRIKAYEKQLDRIKAEISRLVDTLAVCPAAARQPIFDKMEQLDAEKQEAELDLSKLRISAKIQISKEHIADWLKQFCNGDALDVDFQKRIIDTFINSVYLYDDKVIIYYNIEGGKQVSYIDMIDSTEEPPFSDDAPGSSGGSDLKRPALAQHRQALFQISRAVIHLRQNMTVNIYVLIFLLRHLRPHFRSFFAVRTAFYGLRYCLAFCCSLRLCCPKSVGKQPQHPQAVILYTLRHPVESAHQLFFLTDCGFFLFLAINQRIQTHSIQAGQVNQCFHTHAAGSPLDIRIIFIDDTEPFCHQLSAPAELKPPTAHPLSGSDPIICRLLLLSLHLIPHLFLSVHPNVFLLRQLCFLSKLQTSFQLFYYTI